MKFRRFIEVEALHKNEVKGLLNGPCYVFPKIDGTNASVWYDAQKGLCAGSRTREIASSEDDNLGFVRNWVDLNREPLIAFFKEFPRYRLFGEFLVRHQLKTYRNDAWKKFYIFDVVEDLIEDGFEYDTTSIRFLSYEEYRPLLERYGLHCIPLLQTSSSFSLEELKALCGKNDYLIDAGKGSGEGIVIKQYNWKNEFGAYSYGKVVRADFAEHADVPAAKSSALVSVEAQIAEAFVTEGRLNKLLSKMDADGPFTRQRISEFLKRLFHEIVTEEMWQIQEQFKMPAIDMKVLNQTVSAKAKQLKPDLFTA